MVICRPVKLSRQLTNDYQMDFKLQAASILMGVVQLPDGQPAVGAIVLLCANEGDAALMTLPGQLNLNTSRGNQRPDGYQWRFYSPNNSDNGDGLYSA